MVVGPAAASVPVRRKTLPWPDDSAGAGGAGGAALAVALVLVFAFSVSWIWTAVGLALRSAQAVTVISFAVQLPLTFAVLTAVFGPLIMRRYRADLARR